LAEKRAQCGITRTGARFFSRTATTTILRGVIMNFKSIEDIIDYAVEKEEEAVAFYTEISQKETFSGARQTFEEFAQEEKKHAAMLRDFSADKGKMADYTYEWIPDMKRSDYLVDIEYEPGMHYTEILRLAMKREEQALKLYNELAGKTEADDFIKLFQLLAQEEAKHKRVLETIYDDFMAKQGD
jgi:rubrerythrin